MKYTDMITDGQVFVPVLAVVKMAIDGGLSPTDAMKQAGYALVCVTLDNGGSMDDLRAVIDRAEMSLPTANMLSNGAAEA